MAKATNNGICQVCGREQAVHPQTSFLAKHGYTVEWGYFEGTCPGSNFLPIQLDRTIADEELEKLLNFEEYNEKTAKKPIKTVTITRRLRNYPRGTTIETKTYTRSEFELEFPHAYSGWDGAVKNEIDRLLRTAENCRRTRADIVARIDKYYGTPLLPRQMIDKRREPSRREDFRTPREAYARQAELRKQGIESRYMSRNYQPYLIIYGERI